MMITIKPAILFLWSLLPFVSCAPYGSVRNPAILQPEESHDVFADLLKANTSRIDVEVIASLGKNYETNKFMEGPKLRKAVIHSLSTTGMSKDSPYGNTIYRVNNMTEARRILARTWPHMDFREESELGSLFKQHPRASIAFMECDNQRIFFFDENDRLVAIYPDSGGGC